MDRRQWAYQMRVSAAELARGRNFTVHKANGDEQRYANAHYAMSFTKGLDHNFKTGLIDRSGDFVAFRTAIDNGNISAFQDGTVPVSPHKQRQWEAPTAGVVGDLEGPDAQAVTMPPAPALGSDELAYEMAEVYELALLRDVHFGTFEGKSKTGNSATEVDKSLKRLNAMQYTADGFPGRPRKNGGKLITPQQAFRGSSPGVDDGPYLSQFLLIGNDNGSLGLNVADGQVGYGNLRVDQRVTKAAEQDWMISWGDWFKVQQGADVRDNASLFTNAARFITTPRDMASYVHDDALYEAYLNACLILLGMKAPFDPSFQQLAGISGVTQAGGFALYGGPHILTLVTEVATRALKAVRYQKFNNHIRARPEVLAARIANAKHLGNEFPTLKAPLKQLVGVLSGNGGTGTDTLSAIKAHIQGHPVPPGNGGPAGSPIGFQDHLLPMAFQEGSPMHPSYGAGHATVAGACVTVLKAYFDTSALLCGTALKDKKKAKKDAHGNILYEAAFKTGVNSDPLAYRPSANGDHLVPDTSGGYLTLEGELNKLAANISIGRDMAGVHYFSDYYDSLRMGERIAIEMLEEQALCYTTDPFVLSVPTFDGDVVRIGRR